MQVTPRPPLSFGFQLQCFCYVLCDTCLLLAAYLPFALMVKWTPPLSNMRMHTGTHRHTPPPSLQDYIPPALFFWRRNRLLFGYWLFAVALCFLCPRPVYSLSVTDPHSQPAWETIRQQTPNKCLNVGVKSEFRVPYPDDIWLVFHCHHLSPEQSLFAATKCPSVEKLQCYVLQTLLPV